MISSYEYNAPVRKLNFTQPEKMLLLALVEKSKTLIVGTGQDSVSWRTKSEIWQQIAVKFNAHMNERCKRDAKQLRKCWENMKTRYKKNNPGCTAAPEGLFKENMLNMLEIEGRLTNTDEASANDTTKNIIVLEGESLISSAMSSHHDDHASNNTEEEFPSSNNNISQVFSDNEQAHASSIENFSALPSTVDIKQPSKIKAEVSPINDSDFSIVEVTSIVPQAGTNSGVTVVPVHPIKTKTVGTSLHQSEKVTFVKQVIPPAQKRRLLINPGFSKNKIANRESNHRSYSNSQTSCDHRPRPSLLPNRRIPSHSTTTRHVTHNTERILKLRFFRNRIREQETRLRLMQQKIRHERERHEVVMSLLNKRAAYYEAQADDLRSMDLNEDNDLCDDLMWDSLS